ncbi:hypothetical protein [Bordetella flabilis]|uniref:hypothetical protein n=1 Tax=Bordetella flabilis TaxID=463014 RepID=UPI000A0703A3|nr:hypothetical protein [Bordetella flabilis]
MNLPTPPANYSASTESRRNLVLAQADAQNFKRGTDVEIGKGRIILMAPNGARFALTVSNTGVLTTTVA